MNKNLDNLKYSYIEYTALDNQGDFFVLENIREPGQTRLNRNFYDIYKLFISMIINRYSPKKLINVCHGTIGFFNTMEYQEIENIYNHILAKSSKSMNEIKDQSGGKDQLIFLEFDEDFNSDLPDLEKILDFFDKNDIFILSLSSNSIERNFNQIKLVFSKFKLFLNTCIRVKYDKSIILNNISFSGINTVYESDPYICIFTRKNEKQIFFCDYDNHSNFEIINNNFLTNTSGENFQIGKIDYIENFLGFDVLKREERIYRFKESFEKNNQSCKIAFKNFVTDKVIISKINLKKNFDLTLLKNRIIFEQVSNRLNVKNNNQKVFRKIYLSRIDYLEESNDELVIYTLDENICNPIFFNHAINSEFKNFFMDIMPKINSQKFFSLSEIENSNVVLPSIDFQNRISEHIELIDAIKEKFKNYVFNFEDIENVELLNDKYEKITELSGAINSLNQADKIINLINRGESKFVEFKETFSIDLKDGTKKSYIETSSIKTICAFLNTDGGTLIVGVNDNGKVSGLNSEIEKFYKDNDSFMLHFKNIIYSRIGPDFYPFINFYLIELNKLWVLVVECKASKIEVYVDGKDFYVRTNPSTDKLEGPKLVNYIKHHFR